jgi:glycosyltransferase involved in cell wall biosynthesis
MRISPDIAVFLPALRVGGTEKVFLHLVKAFVEMGYTVDLLLRERDGPYLADVPKQVSIFDLRGHKNLKAIIPLLHYLRQRHPFVLLSALDHINMTAIWAKLISKVETRVVVSVRTLISHAYQFRWKDKQSLFIPLIKITYPLADSIICVCNAVKRDLLNIIGEKVKKKIVVIYNPILIDYIRQKSKESLDSSIFPFKTIMRPMILSVGRLDIAKDYPTLIKAFKKLLDTQIAYLLIIGEGKERKNLQMLTERLNISRYCHLIGFVSNPYPYIAKADLFVLSSKWEGFPNVVAEALALYRPIVATDCGGVREILANGKWGRIVPVGDIETLSITMNEELKKPFILNLDELEKYLQNFDLKLIAQKYIEVLLK